MLNSRHDERRDRRKPNQKRPQSNDPLLRGMDAMRHRRMVMAPVDCGNHLPRPEEILDGKQHCRENDKIAKDDERDVHQLGLHDVAKRIIRREISIRRTRSLRVRRCRDASCV